jgi:pre-mRNA-splicing factor ISY1
MSRNEEKAKAALNRWRQLSSGHATAGAEAARTRKRTLASDCTSLAECERHRKELVDSITAKLEEIQHMLPDDKCKTLNDQINKLIRIKGHWERQIRALGGTDYRPKGEKEDRNGYMYFGAAKELPEIKAFLRRSEADTNSSSLHQISKIPTELLDYQYYGFDDEDLLELEAEAEDQIKRSYLKNNVKRRTVEVHWNEKWKIPSAEEIEKAILEYKKAALIKKYAV